MSKLDAQRAMREARYAATQARAAKSPTQPASETSAKPVAKRATKTSAKPTKPTVEPVGEESVEGLCGHRAISGKTCTRERGHTAKSHRYS